eukprot:g2089.t1
MEKDYRRDVGKEGEKPLQVVVDESELVRLMANFLEERGYVESMRCIERETGVVSEIFDEDLGYFRSLLLDGRWDDALSFVDVFEEQSDYDQKLIRFNIKKQQFLELVHAGQQQNIGIGSTVSSAVVEFVKELQQLRELCGKEEFNALWQILTLECVADHPDLKGWTPHRGRLWCFRRIRSSIEKALSLEEPRDSTEEDRIPRGQLENLVAQASTLKMEPLWRARRGQFPERFKADLTYRMLPAKPTAPLTDSYLPFACQVGVSVSMRCIRSNEKISLSPAKSNRKVTQSRSPFTESSPSRMSKDARKSTGVAVRDLFHFEEEEGGEGEGKESKGGLATSSDTVADAPTAPTIPRVSESDAKDTKGTFNVVGGTANAEEGVPRVASKETSRTRLKMLETSAILKEMESQTRKNERLLAATNGIEADTSLKMETPRRNDVGAFIGSAATATTDDSGVYTTEGPLSALKEICSATPRVSLTRAAPRTDVTCTGVVSQKPREIMSKKPPTSSFSIDGYGGVDREIVKVVEEEADIDEEDKMIEEAGFHEPIPISDLYEVASDHKTPPPTPADDEDDDDERSRKATAWSIDTTSGSNAIRVGPSRPFRLPRRLQERQKRLEQLREQRRKLREIGMSQVGKKKKKMKREEVKSRSAAARKSRVEREREFSQLRRKAAKRLETVSHKSHASSRAAASKRGGARWRSQRTKKGGDAEAREPPSSSPPSALGRSTAALQSKTQSIEPKHRMQLTGELPDDAESSVKSAAPICFAQAVRAVSFDTLGELCAVGTNGREVQVYAISSNGESKLVLKRENHHLGSVYCSAFSPDGMAIATGSNDKVLRLMHLERDYAPVASDGSIGVDRVVAPVSRDVILAGHNGTIRSVAFASNGNLLSAGAGDCAIRLWNPSESRDPLRVMQGHTAPIFEVEPGIDQHTVLSCGGDSTVRVWDVRMRLAARVVATNSATNSISIAPSAPWLVASAHLNGNVSLWDMRKGRCLETMPCHRDECRSVHVSPSGKWILSASFDGKICATPVDSTARGAIGSLGRHTWKGHTGKVLRARWHPRSERRSTGPRFVSCSADRTVRFWG